MKGFMCQKMTLYHDISYSSTVLRTFANVKINFYLNELLKKTLTF